MPVSTQQYPVKLTQAQRGIVAEIIPDPAHRLKVNEWPQQTIPFTVDEIKFVRAQAAAALRECSLGSRRNSVVNDVDIATQALECSQGVGEISVKDSLYQFKFTLLNSQPAIWRRIQVRDCTLDKLHIHVQTAMGWTNSHLHDFKIGWHRYGEPLLMRENFDEMNYADSTSTNVSEILRKSGRQCRFQYEYAFGDCLEHEVLFEGCARAEQVKGYPLRVEVACACPLEDVSGT